MIYREMIIIQLGGDILLHHVICLEDKPSLQHDRSIQ
jgi:hypothetical protein